MQEPTSSLVPVGPGPLVELLGDATTIAPALATYIAGRKAFLAGLMEALTAGVDYMLIHRKVNKQDCPEKANKIAPACALCGGKATLCKPGSEQLCGILRLTPRFRRDRDTWEMLGKVEGMLCFVCELVNPAGVIVAEGRGARSLKQDYGDDPNKTVKMAQKSAQTDAVLRCAGLSEIFTQDLEDMPVPTTDANLFGEVPTREPGSDDLSDQLQDSIDQARDRKQPERRSSPPQESPPRAARAPQSPAERPMDPKPEGAISEGRVRRLYALCREQVHGSEDQFQMLKLRLKAAAKAAWDIDHLEHCHWRDYDTLCEWITTPPPERRPAARRIPRR